MNQETSMLNDVSQWTDQALIANLLRLVRADRTLSVRLLVHLGEMDARRLYREQAYASMFEYAVRALLMSEAEAYLRIQAARLGRQFPLVLTLLGSGALHLTGLKLLSPHLTLDNHVQLLDRARGKSKREIELLVAAIAPKPDVPSQLRRLPQAQGSRACRSQLHDALQAAGVEERVASSVQPADTADAVAEATLCTTGSVTSAARSVAESRAASAKHAPQPPVADTQRPAFALQPPRARASCAPLSPSRYKLQLTVSQPAHDKLEQLKELLRHRVPDGDLATIVELALDALLDKTMKQRFAQTAASKKSRAALPQTPETQVGRHGAPEKRVVQPAAPERPRVDDAAATRKLPACNARLLSRYIPRAVLREVHARDGGQCTFVSTEGQRCAARGFLELHHHDTPYARGGKAAADNLRLMCRAHNALLAERDFGRGFMFRKLQQVRADRDTNAFARHSQHVPQPLLALAPERGAHV